MRNTILHASRRCLAESWFLFNRVNCFALCDILTHKCCFLRSALQRSHLTIFCLIRDIDII